MDVSASKIEEPGLDQISVFISIISKWNNFELKFSREVKHHVFFLKQRIFSFIQNKWRFRKFLFIWEGQTAVSCHVWYQSLCSFGRYLDVSLIKCSANLFLSYSIIKHFYKINFSYKVTDHDRQFQCKQFVKSVSINTVHDKKRKILNTVIF